MTRLIDADAFKKILSEHEMKHDKRRSFDDYDCGAANAYEHASDLLDEMPTVEKPHGAWIFEEWVGYIIPDTGDVVCSECKTALFEGVSKRKFDVLSYNFCPNCGVSMKKEGE